MWGPVEPMPTDARSACRPELESGALDRPANLALDHPSIENGRTSSGHEMRRPAHAAFLLFQKKGRTGN